MSDLGPLSSTLADLLEAEREIDPLPADQKERVLSRILASVPAPPVSLPPSGGEAVAIANASLRGKIVGVGLVIVGALGGVAGDRALRRESADRAAGDASPMHKIELLVSIETHEARLPSEASVDPPRSSKPLEAPGSSAAKLAPSAASDRARLSTDLKRERLLLETARAALQRRDPTSAGAALAEHARLFPRGQLAEERALLMRATKEIASE